MGEDMTITYESLYDSVRKEKNSGNLVSVEKSVYNSMASYLESKIKIYKNSKGKILENELAKQKEQINSARKLIKLFYENRERKILDVAMSKSRTSVVLSEETALLEHEKQIVKEIQEILDKYRKQILIPTLNAHVEETKKPDNIMLRFIGPVPKFYGLNKEIFGPYEEGEIANLPKEVADVLIRRERAEEIKQSQFS